MIEIKHLYKKYKQKKGPPVIAIDDVSFTLPDSGIIFLLGKSGSGKSTLLNLLGGLDDYDNGDMIINGVSSKSFKQKDFDSYRNAYVGFVFQEYNILNEFTVGANIALAIELQGRKATNEEINDILEKVDLIGYGNRKPNELSGGQKQRVAIARALIKNPNIILADEPTGALDTSTGEQVLSTLKKLSKDKLVVVVSHDKNFAERYADRIIEISDGKIINDIEFDDNYKQKRPNVPYYDNNIISIPDNYYLTEQDLYNINNYLYMVRNGDIKIDVAPENKTQRYYRLTDESKIKKTYNNLEFVKSKLSIKSSFKIGLNGLKYKKIRLFITILLSCISFILFGLTNTFGSYNNNSACIQSIIDSDISYVSIAKNEKIKDGSGNYYWTGLNKFLSDKDIEIASSSIGIQLSGVYKNELMNLSFSSNYDKEIQNDNSYNIYSSNFIGFSEVNETSLKSMGYSVLAGTLPDGNANEIAISDYVYKTFEKYGYKEINNTASNSSSNIKKYEDIIGKKIAINKNEYKITAVINTNFDFERYQPLTNKDNYNESLDNIKMYALQEELEYARNYSLCNVAMVGNGFIDNLLKTQSKAYSLDDENIVVANDEYVAEVNYISRLSDINTNSIKWINGKRKTLKDNEVIITTDCIYEYPESETAIISSSSNQKNNYENLIKENNKAKYHMYNNETPNNDKEEDCIVVGIIDTSEFNDDYINGTIICSDTKFNSLIDNPDDIYSCAVGAMPKEKDKIKKIVDYCYDDSNDIRYALQNSVTYELNTINEILQSLSNIFVYIGIGVAAFAAIMFSNFIGTSIYYKKREIGILKAIGAGSNDIFRIFFAESFVIAIINFIISSIGSSLLINKINSILRIKTNILITVLNFAIKQVLLLLILSISIAFFASFIPIKKVASKKPVDVIKK